MKKLKLYIAANAMLIWLIAIILLMTASVSFGAYTYMKYAKRVVSTVNDYGIPFSSNLLSQFDSKRLSAKDFSEKEYNDLILTLSGSNDTNSSSDSRVIKICNYPQNDINAVSKGEIGYSININVKNPDGTDMNSSDIQKYGIKVELNFNNSTVLEITSDGKGEYKNPVPLKEGDTDVHIYTLTVGLNDVKDCDKFFISVSAVPDSKSKEYTSDKMLARNIRYILSAGSENWEGKYVDDFSEEKTPNKYDGFNYEISGNGSGECVLQWNSDYVILDPEFKNTLESDQIDIKNTKENTLAFYVGGDYAASRYCIQFYRVKPVPNDEEFYDNGSYGVYREVDEVKYSYVTMEYKVADKKESGQ